MRVLEWEAIEDLKPILSAARETAIVLIEGRVYDLIISINTLACRR